MRRSADKFPLRTALITKNTRLSYQSLNARVNQLANKLLKTGLQKGDRVAVLLHNCIEFIEVYFACAKSGGVFVPINNLLKEKELRQILEYIQPRFFIIDPDFQSVVQNLVARMPFMEYLCCLGEGPERPFLSYESLVKGGAAHEPEVTISDDDLMSIFLTSGTTGQPKGAMRSHRQDVMNAMTGAIEMKLDYSDRAVLLFPLYHVTFEDQLRYFLMGNTIYLRKEGAFDPKEVLEILSNERITICQFVPTMVSAMLEEQDIEKYDLSHLRLILYAAAPMPVELLKRAMARFKCDFAQFYGQTETGPIITLLRPEDHILDGSNEQLARLASSGRAVVDYEVRIVDENGKDVSVREVGEIIVRSEAVMDGYWNLPEETAKTIRDGWIHTGDFGRYDDEKYVYIVDRKNDMIISGGKNIYPRELEEVIYTHPAVMDVAVIGVPDDYWGESVKAIVVLKEGMNTTEEEIISLCKENLASYKKPKTVEFRKELPRSSTGKILKKDIREEYWKGKDRRV
jgi:acyl-CoA synthetase (AMP-forming)/AMP-acid ligase II